MNTHPRRHVAVIAVALIFLLCALLFARPTFAAEEQKTPQPSANTETTQNAPTAEAPTQTAPARDEENERLAFMEQDRAPVPGEAPSTFGLLSRTLGALLLIIGLIFGASWALKRFGGQRFGAPAAGSPALNVLSTVALGDRRSLSVVRFGSRTLLVGSTQQTITLLAEEAGDEVLMESEPPVRSVADMLKQSRTEAESFDEELAEARLRLEAGQAEGHWQFSEGGHKA